MMKKAEIDTLATPWANAQVAHLLSVHRMMAIVVGDNMAEVSNSDDYDQVMFTQNVENYRGLLLPCGAGESGKGLHLRTY